MAFSFGTNDIAPLMFMWNVPSSPKQHVPLLERTLRSDAMSRESLFSALSYVVFSAETYSESNKASSTMMLELKPNSRCGGMKICSLALYDAGTLCAKKAPMPGNITQL